MTRDLFGLTSAHCARVDDADRRTKLGEKMSSFRSKTNFKSERRTARSRSNRTKTKKSKTKTFNRGRCKPRATNDKRRVRESRPERPSFVQRTEQRKETKRKENAIKKITRPSVRPSSVGERERPRFLRDGSLSNFRNANRSKNEQVRDVRRFVAAFRPFEFKKSDVRAAKERKGNRANAKAKRGNPRNKKTGGRVGGEFAILPSRDPAPIN